MAMIVAVALIFPITMLATPSEGKDRGKRGSFNYVKNLNLTEDQLATVREMRSSTKKEMIQLKSRHQILEIDLETELQKENPDTKVVDQIIGEISGISAKQTSARLGMRVKLMSVLTPEQKQKLAQSMSGRMFGGPGEGRHKEGRDDDRHHRPEAIGGPMGAPPMGDLF